MNAIRTTLFRTLAWGLLVLALLDLAAGSPEPLRSYDAEEAPPLPEFTQTSDRAWLNSEPLRLGDLRGRVLLVDIWTFKCWNCYRSFPWLTGLEQRFSAEDFQVIGVHTPEFDSERDRDAVAGAMDRFGLLHPVMMDNDYRYWRALNNRFWPTYYLVDRGGRIRDVFIGETHAGDAQARRMEARIAALVAER